jgi:hypothetical protein
MYIQSSLLSWFIHKNFPRFLYIVFLSVLIFPTRPGVAQPLHSINEATTMNIGTLYEGQPTIRKLAIINDGNKILHINRLWTSCGCTAATLPSNDISPGTHETLSVSFDTKDLQGKFKREVHIASNDTRNPQFDITFEGTIVPVVLVSPRYVSFDRMNINHRLHKTVQIMNTISDTIRIKSCSSPERQMSLSLDTNIVPPDSSLQVRIDMLPVTKGNVLGQIELVTDNKLKPVIKISYVGTVK